jgi:pimeloyl-ACP methyl ester carboxylesterase
MIYEQPVIYELKDIKVRTLLIIGTLDRTIVGKAKVPKEKINTYGQYQKLGKQINQILKGSKLIELPEVGHIPHIQEPGLFKKHIRDFLELQ